MDNPIFPIVKWVGGKRQLLNHIHLLLPEKFSCYCEPFLGGGAVLFSIKPSVAIVNDLNGELINLYQVVRDNLEALIFDLKKHQNTIEYFYMLRDLDRNCDSYDSMTDVERASRFLYLNKTCFNGLFRVNSLGQFNAPFGYYKNPNIVNEIGLKLVHDYIIKSDIMFYAKDFADVLQLLPDDSFVYLDPPYDPISKTSNFTYYCKTGFDRKDQIRLKECCDDLTKRNIKFMLSNSSTSFIQDLYSDYNMVILPARRSVNSVSDKRGYVNEILIRNYIK